MINLKDRGSGFSTNDFLEYFKPPVPSSFQWHQVKAPVQFRFFGRTNDNCSIFEISYFNDTDCHFQLHINVAENIAVGRCYHLNTWTNQEKYSLNHQLKKASNFVLDIYLHESVAIVNLDGHKVAIYSCVKHLQQVREWNVKGDISLNLIAVQKQE